MDKWSSVTLELVTPFRSIGKTAWDPIVRTLDAQEMPWSDDNWVDEDAGGEMVKITTFADPFKEADTTIQPEAEV